MSDHIGESNAMTCPHCGLPFVREQNCIRSFGCGSSFAEAFRPQWARSMTCLEIENGQLREMFQKANLHALDLADRIKRLEEAGGQLMMWIGEDISDSNRQLLEDHWNKAKEDKP